VLQGEVTNDVCVEALEVRCPSPQQVLHQAERACSAERGLLHAGVNLQPQVRDGLDVGVHLLLGLADAEDDVGHLDFLEGLKLPCEDGFVEEVD